jgi:hypothetical protein
MQNNDIKTVKFQIEKKKMYIEVLLLKKDM